MKVKCEYCGAHFNTLKHTSCPSCGATLEGNDDLQEELAKQREIDQLNIQDIENRIERERLANEAERQRQENGWYTKRPVTTTNVQPKKKRSWASVWIIIIILFFVFSSMISVLLEKFEEIDKTHHDSNKNIQATEIQEIHVSTFFGNKANTGKVAVSCVEAEEYYYPWTKPAAGNKYIRYRIVVENVYDKKISVGSDVICTYTNDEGNTIQADVPTISSDDLGTRLRNASLIPGAATEGWVYFEVPENADVMLYYGEYVAISVSHEDWISTDA